MPVDADAAARSVVEDADAGDWWRAHARPGRWQGPRPSSLRANALTAARPNPSDEMPTPLADPSAVSDAAARLFAAHQPRPVLRTIAGVSLGVLAVAAVTAGVIWFRRRAVNAEPAATPPASPPQSSKPPSLTASQYYLLGIDLLSAG